MIAYKRVGGLRFVRIGRLSVTFTVRRAVALSVSHEIKRANLERKRANTLAALRGDDFLPFSDFETPAWSDQ